MPIAVSVTVLILYVIIWLIIAFILAVAYSDRPLRNRGDRFAEYLWNNQRALYIIFWIMLILLPLPIIWAILDIVSHGRKQDYEYIIKRMRDNPDEFTITKKKIKSGKVQKVTTVSNEIIAPSPSPIELEDFK